MTITGLFRRFGSNVKMFPTLALVTLIVAVAEIDIVSTFFGFWKMVNVFTTEAILAFALAYIILNKSPNLTTLVQTFVDRLMDPNTSWYAPYAHKREYNDEPDYDDEPNYDDYDDEPNYDEAPAPEVAASNTPDPFTVANVDKETVKLGNQRKEGHDQSYSDLGGYECYPDCKACETSAYAPEPGR